MNFWLGMIFIAPWTIGFLIFTVYPMVASLIYSFSEYHIRAPLEWIGLANYINLFQDKLFYTALINTTYMVVVGVPLTLLLSFLCAIVLNIKVPGPIHLPRDLLPAQHRPDHRQHDALVVDPESQFGLDEYGPGGGRD